MWVIRRESTLNLWFDRWLDQGPLWNLLPCPLTREEYQLEVKDVVSASGWRWDSISMGFPQDVVLGIQATPFAIVARSRDRLAWAGTSNGMSSLQSAYVLAVCLENAPIFERQWIWKTNTLLNIQLFLWKCYHQSIGVKSCLYARGVDSGILCPLCQLALETIIHALCDCTVIRLIWHQLGR